jgi:hypothetical protein
MVLIQEESMRLFYLLLMVVFSLAIASCGKQKPDTRQTKKTADQNERMLNQGVEADTMMKKLENSTPDMGKQK